MSIALSFLSVLLIFDELFEKNVDLFSPIDIIADKDPYPIDALPTCNHALNLCLRGKPCSQIYKDFKTNCKIQEGQCKMENR